jgi:hypothetical protein
MIITVERGGREVTRWGFSITSAHYVWEKAGVDLRTFEGCKSSECAPLVRDVVSSILMNPEAFIGVVRYHDLRGTTAALTTLFFTLRECPEGVVRVT